MKILIAKKLNMTRIFDKDGNDVAVTVVETADAEIKEVKTVESKSGYNAYVVGYRNGKKDKLVEFRFEGEAEYKKGDKLVAGKFDNDEVVSLIGTSKGKGFAGVIKRHNFSRGPMSHGSNHQRKVGSIGAAYPQHVLKGQKMPGRMGNERITVKNVKVLETSANLLLISGAVPGNRGNIIKLIAK